MKTKSDTEVEDLEENMVQKKVYTVIDKCEKTKGVLELEEEKNLERLFAVTKFMDKIVLKSLILSMLMQSLCMTHESIFFIVTEMVSWPRYR